MKPSDLFVFIFLDHIDKFLKILGDFCFLNYLKSIPNNLELIIEVAFLWIHNCLYFFEQIIYFEKDFFFIRKLGFINYTCS